MIDPAIARTAAAAFAARQAVARQMIRGGKMTRAEADRRLAPWAAIACLAGADLPELAEPLAERVTRDVADYWQVTEAQARAELAPAICPRARWAPLLAKARDAAIRTADQIAGSARARPDEYPAARDQAFALIALADALRLDPNGRHDVPLAFADPAFVKEPAR